MRILHVGAFPFPMHLGSQVYVRGLASALARRGHDVSVAVYAHGDGEVAGVRILRSRYGRFEASGPHLSRPAADASLAHVLSRLRVPVDVVHGHNAEATVVARAALGRKAPPILYGQHGRMDEELPGYWPYPGMGVLGALLDRWACASSDAALALSPRGAAHLRTLHSGVYEAPPGVDVADLRGGDSARARARWDLGERPWVLYAGNLDAYQDLPVLCAAMRRLSDVGLLVVTGDDGPLETGLDPSRLRVVRTRSFADTKDAMAAAALAAVPRSRCAGFPIKLLNLLGAGCVAVVAEGSAVPVPGAVVVPNGRADEMADAIANALADPIATRGLGEHAREAIARDWCWEVRVRAVEQVYQDLLDDRAARAGGSGA